MAAVMLEMVGALEGEVLMSLVGVLKWCCPVALTLPDPMASLKWLHVMCRF